MTTLIVDWRKARAQALKKYCEEEGSVVDAVAAGAACEALPDVDLVLVHVGDSQEEEGKDDIEALLRHYGTSTWTLCYSGGEPLPVASGSSLPCVAVFPGLVGLPAPGQPFLDLVSRVLKAARTAGCPSDHFRALVLGYDELLEAKLEFLGWLIGGAAASKKRVGLLEAAYPADMAGAAPPCDTAAIQALRDRFFGA